MTRYSNTSPDTSGKRKTKAGQSIIKGAKEALDYAKQEKRDSLVDTWRNLSEEDLAYIAGFLDGEGSFCIKTDRSNQISVSANNAYHKTIFWLHENFGGCVTKVKKQKDHHKQLYQWHVTGRKALILCQVLAPYLKQKAGQACVLILVQQTKDKGYYKLPNELIKERHRLASILKGLHDEPN